MSAKRGLDQGESSPKKRRRTELLDSNPVEGVPPDPKKASFEALLKRATADEVVWEFNFFLKSLSHNISKITLITSVFWQAVKQGWH